MRQIPASLRWAVIQRAANRCEYCGLAQTGQAATFHIDHIIPVAAGGATTSDNLALACVSCSLRKSARQVAVDPQTDADAPIYNPRKERWSEHFRWEDVRIVGLTPMGRATVAALQMNRPVILAIRAEEKVFNRHPPAL
ncbi:MAG: HNH endonuclease [Caldilineaceae bacterium]|nr:HNH endonuclease [Caldilineaceae bacterium]HRJ44136.1 HNH endonuclease signature motif containing protein [Caldilineaceae bacterium]